MKKLRISALLLAGSAGLMLAACGGGGGGGDHPPPYDPTTAATPPDSASASARGFLEFIDGLSKQMLDNREPFDLAAFTGPSENVDNAEPVALSIDQ